MDLSLPSEANVSLIPQSLLFQLQFQTSKLFLLLKGDRGGVVFIYIYGKFVDPFY